MELMKTLRFDVEIDESNGKARFFDWYGDSWGDTVEEQRIIDEQLRTKVGFKLGYEVVFTRFIHAGNGHFEIEFKRK
jgi:hypothetical protein